MGGVVPEPEVSGEASRNPPKRFRCGSIPYLSATGIPGLQAGEDVNGFQEHARYGVGFRKTKTPPQNPIFANRRRWIWIRIRGMSRGFGILDWLSVFLAATVGWVLESHGVILLGVLVAWVGRNWPMLVALRGVWPLAFSMVPAAVAVLLVVGGVIAGVWPERNRDAGYSEEELERIRMAVSRMRLNAGLDRITRAGARYSASRSGMDRGDNGVHGRGAFLCI